MKKLIFLFVVLFAVGCSKPEYIVGETPNVGMQNIFYMKDLRTKLCFAYIGNDSRSLTNVPCTPEVERYIR